MIIDWNVDLTNNSYLTYNNKVSYPPIMEQPFNTVGGWEIWRGWNFFWLRRRGGVIFLFMSIWQAILINVIKKLFS